MSYDANEERSKAITVAELIELLKQAPQDSAIEADGCDCVEAAVGIEIREEGRTLTGPTVVVSRTGGEGVLQPERLQRDSG